MNAWANDLGDLRVRSVALPRDGGVLNRANKYSLRETDLARTFAAERKRLKAAALAAQQAAPAPTTVVALQPRSRP